MAEWEKARPRIYNVVTGFFPESSPRATWETNPRPLLVCGVATHEETGRHFCRIAYGTTQHLELAKPTDLVIGNLSELDALGLKYTTRFVTNSGKQMVILPWDEEHFRPWSGKRSPVLGLLPEDMQHFLGRVLTSQLDLPQF